MEIKLFHLVSGKDVITKVSVEEDGVYWVSPFEFIFSPMGSGLLPFVAMAKGHKFRQPKQEFIMVECVPADNMLEEYTKAINPKAIQEVKKPGLLVPGR